jgi:hypothetical protein
MMNRIQILLDREARLSNTGQKDDPTYAAAHEELKHLRGTEAPVCWGEDDCSTLILSQCPWRIDCYEGDR